MRYKICVLFLFVIISCQKLAQPSLSDTSFRSGNYKDFIYVLGSLFQKGSYGQLYVYSRTEKRFFNSTLNVFSDAKIKILRNKYICVVGRADDHALRMYSPYLDFLFEVSLPDINPQDIELLEDENTLMIISFLSPDILFFNIKEKKWLPSLNINSILEPLITNNDPDGSPEMSSLLSFGDNTYGVLIERLDRTRPFFPPLFDSFFAYFSSPQDLKNFKLIPSKFHNPTRMKKYHEGKTIALFEAGYIQKGKALDGGLRIFFWENNNLIERPSIVLEKDLLGEVIDFEIIGLPKDNKIVFTVYDGTNSYLTWADGKILWKSPGYSLGTLWMDPKSQILYVGRKTTTVTSMLLFTYQNNNLIYLGTLNTPTRLPMEDILGFF